MFTEHFERFLQYLELKTAFTFLVLICSLKVRLRKLESCL